MERVQSQLRSLGCAFVVGRLTRDGSALDLPFRRRESDPPGLTQVRSRHLFVGVPSRSLLRLVHCANPEQASCVTNSAFHHIGGAPWT